MIAHRRDPGPPLSKARAEVTETIVGSRWRAGFFSGRQGCAAGCPMLPRCAHAFWPFQGILTSAAGAFSRRARPRPRAMAGSRRRCSTWGACARPGGGGKKRVVGDPTLLADLLALVDPDARSDPMSPLLWTCRSLSQLARALTARGHRVGRTLVGELLRAQRFSLQANRKTRRGGPPRPRRAVPPCEQKRAASSCGGRAGDLG